MLGLKLIYENNMFDSVIMGPGCIYYIEEVLYSLLLGDYTIVN